MAVKKSVLVRVRARASFNEVRQGDEATVELDARVQGWLQAGLVEVVGGGTDPAGPGGAEPDSAGRVQD